MTGFFVSYTAADKDWAEWIAFVLEEAGFSTVIQAWDFRPGSNFVLAMQDAASQAERTVLVLSDDYLRSEMASPEQAGAFAQDPKGLELKLLPVMVRACQPQGLLRSIVQIRIMGLDEAAAREAILSGAKKGRAKPTERPRFPGLPRPSGDRGFPPAVAKATQARRPVLPQLAVPMTDANRRRFAKLAFAEIRHTFGENLQQAVAEDRRVEFDLTDTSATDFRSELFLDGRSKGSCRVWLGGMMGDNSICFAEGRTSGNACNEILTPSEGEEEPLLSATMAMGFSDFERETEADMKRLTPQQAAAYLWARFTGGFR